MEISHVWLQGGHRIGMAGPRDSGTANEFLVRFVAVFACVAEMLGSKIVLVRWTSIRQRNVPNNEDPCSLNIALQYNSCKDNFQRTKPRAAAIYIDAVISVRNVQMHWRRVTLRIISWYEFGTIGHLEREPALRTFLSGAVSWMLSIASAPTEHGMELRYELGTHISTVCIQDTSPATHIGNVASIVIFPISDVSRYCIDPQHTIWV